MAKAATAALASDAKQKPNGKSAKAGKPAKAGKKKGAALRIFLLLLGSIALIFLIKHSFIFLMIGMMPTVIAYLVDSDSEKQRFRVVRNFNLIGVLPSLPGLIAQGNSVVAVHGALSNPYSWLTMYGAALVGFLLVWITPAISYFLMDLNTTRRIRRLEKAQDTLRKEWGPGVVTGYQENHR